MKRPGGRPPYKWTDTTIGMLVDGWNDGTSIASIAADIGTAHTTVRRKVKELGLTRPPKAREAGNIKIDSSWDDRLFESWADRKARLARERANG